MKIASFLKIFSIALLLGSVSAQVRIDFLCYNGITVPGQSVYVVGNVTQLGGWNRANAVKLDPANYPTWKELFPFHGGRGLNGSA
eukprot:IDg3095t1